MIHPPLTMLGICESTDEAEASLHRAIEFERGVIARAEGSITRYEKMLHDLQGGPQVKRIRAVTSDVRVGSSGAPRVRGREEGSSAR